MRCNSRCKILFSSIVFKYVYYLVGWLGYPDDVIQKLTKKYLGLGYKSFKIKVGLNKDDDYRRCSLIRKEIGWENDLVLIIFLL